MIRSCAVTLVMLVMMNGMAIAKDSNWPGIDESVVERIARQQGRAAHEPLINSDQGDLLLFVFLAAGAVGGFIAGYYWRVLTEDKRNRQNDTTDV